MVICIYILGGTITHALSLGNHELTHNLAIETPIYNESLGIFINIAHIVQYIIHFIRNGITSRCWTFNF